MNDRDMDWYELRVKDFLAQVSDTAPDDPPGAVAAVAAALATAAALLNKCSGDPQVKAELASVSTRLLTLSILDGRAYLEWRAGDSASKAVAHFPREVARLAERVVAIAEDMPPNVLTGMTDIVAASRLATGCVAAAVAVCDGNGGLL